MRETTVADWLDVYKTASGQPHILRDKKFDKISCLNAQAHKGGDDKRESMWVNLETGHAGCHYCGVKWGPDQLRKELLQRGFGVGQAPWRSAGELQRVSRQRRVRPARVGKEFDPDHIHAQWRFVYRDREGKPYGMVFRWDGPDGKRILQSSRYQDRWHWGLHDETPNHLFHVELLVQPRVDGVASAVVVEGEKKAVILQRHLNANARARGEDEMAVIVVTWRGGARAWKQCSDWSVMAGRDVVLWPDNDDPGRVGMGGILEEISGAGMARRVWVVETLGVEGLKEGDDLVDLVNRGVDPIAWMREHAKLMYKEVERRRSAEIRGGVVREL